MLYIKPMKKHELRDNLELHDIINELLLNSKPVKHFRGDITYDILNIVNINNESKYTSLIWIVRENGTWLLNENFNSFNEDYQIIETQFEDIKREFRIIFNQNEQERWSIERLI